MDKRLVILALLPVLLLALYLAGLNGRGDTQPPRGATRSATSARGAGGEGAVNGNVSGLDIIPVNTPARNTSPINPERNESRNLSDKKDAGKLVNETQGGGLALLASVKSWAYQLQNADPGQIAVAGFDLAVIDYSRDGSDEGAYTRGEIVSAEKKGVVMVAYLNIGEAEDYRFYWREEWSRSPPEWLGPENPEWKGDYAVRYWHEEWKEIVFRYLDRIIAQGFQGVYLDNVDEFEYWGEHGVDEAWAAWEMIRFIEEIASYARRKAGPGFLVFVQNGEGLLDYDNGSLLSTVSGWASEDVFYDGLEPSEWTAEKVPRLNRVAKAGKLVLVVDYVDDGSHNAVDLRRIERFRSMALERGYVPYAALVDRELDELNVIPGVQP